MTSKLTSSSSTSSWSTMLFMMVVVLVLIKVDPIACQSLELRQAGKFEFELTEAASLSGSKRELVSVVKNVFATTQVRMRIACPVGLALSLGWVVRESHCWNELSILGAMEEAVLERIYAQPALPISDNKAEEGRSAFAKCNKLTLMCQGQQRYVPIQPCDPSELQASPSFFGSNATTSESRSKEESANATAGSAASGPMTPLDAAISLDRTADYIVILSVHIENKDDQKLAPGFKTYVEFDMNGPRGYLSVTEWPLLPFYGFMCLFYLVLAVLWLVVSFRHFRDLLRIQFWIAAVIALGMVEKAFFLAHLEQLNANGKAHLGLFLVAETVSCAKRTLSRLLVLIVSLGFGLVKPRLGPLLHRIVAVGVLYFVCALTEAYLRVTEPQSRTNVSGAASLAAIPLAVIDSTICWWIFNALTETTRTLRLRRNVIKLNVYRCFTNVLVFAVVASVLFMLWSIHFHRTEQCLKDWQDLWIDEAFWHVLFSFLLSVIMFLWRPSQNNQRYAFTPLLDREEDGYWSDDASDTSEESSPFFKDKVSLRNVGKKAKTLAKSEQEERDEALQWIEENIPESENPLPVLDSEEEIETTNFEMSKMQ